MNENLDFEELKINPDRICEGISKIGYKPASAIMDIVDNSITAGATTIHIDFLLKPEHNINTKNNIESIRITDNGCGMNVPQIKSALDIGSLIEYSPNSLSKFGLGLKSAGFSLGRRIQVVSKQQGSLSDAYYLDRDIIRDKQKYGVCRTDVPQDFTEILNEFDSGTVVEITNLIEPQDTANKIYKELSDRLGVTYYHFLSRESNPITITIKIQRHGNSIQQRIVEPIDILFWDIANDSFDPDTYDGKLPCKVLDAEIENPYNSQGEKIRIKAVIFPKQDMAKFLGFSEEERGTIERFKITRANSGFFFFRNERLIRWGDNIAGAGRDDIGFRAKVMLTTEHDELFHVDVSKQELFIPDEILETLKLRVRIPLDQSRQLFRKCDSIKSQNQGREGEEFNRRSETFPEEDPDELIMLPSPHEKTQRKQKILEKSKKIEEEEPLLNDSNLPSTASEEVPFQKIRYTESMNSLNFWESGQHTQYGTFVRINKNHPYYQVALSRFESSSPERLAIENLIFSLAVAQNKTIENLNDISYEIIEKVLNKFNSVSSYTLNSWITQNQDLFGA